MITAQEAKELFEKNEKYNRNLTYYKNAINEEIKTSAKRGERKAGYVITGHYSSAIGHEIKKELLENGFRVIIIDTFGQCELIIKW